MRARIDNNWFLTLGRVLFNYYQLSSSHSSTRATRHVSASRSEPFNSHRLWEEKYHRSRPSMVKSMGSAYKFRDKRQRVWTLINSISSSFFFRLLYSNYCFNFLSTDCRNSFPNERYYFKAHGRKILPKLRRQIPKKYEKGAPTNCAERNEECLSVERCYKIEKVL